MEPEMNVTSAQYLKDYTDTISCIEATIGGELMYVPIAEGNRHYDEIMRQVAAGTLTITPAS